jgi:nucleoside-diphosphate-sugar epimerase
MPPQLTVADAIKAQNAYISYCVAKKVAEEVIWAYVAESKPHYTVTVFLPALIFGPPIQPIASLKKINYSTDVFYSLFNGTYEVTPPTSFPSYIDIRDLASAHIKSLTTPAVANERMLVGGLKYSSQIAVDVLKMIPKLEGRLPKDNDEDTPTVKFGDVLEWNEKLGLKLRTPEETFRDAARRFLALEKGLK